MSSDVFPILSHGIYANHAAIAPWPRPTAEAVAAFAADNAERGPAAYREWIRREAELRELAARLINIPNANDVALIKNTSEGVSIVAKGYPWAQGDNVVLPAGEFPSNRLPWLSLEGRGVSVREVDIRVEHPEQALIEAMDRRTRVLAVCSIQYSDGFRLDIEQLGAACDSAGVLFFVDAIQHLGALPFDAVAASVACLAAGAHKWMLGPEGIGIFYCREDVRSRIALSQHGWHMYDYPWHFEREDWTPSLKARRFEAGSPNTLGQAALHTSLTLLLDSGIEYTSARVLANTARLLAGLGSLPDVEIRSPTEDARLSGIVSFSPGARDAREIFRRLSNAGVTCAFRNGAVRLSPHFYQDEAVINRILNHVEDSL